LSDARNPARTRHVLWWLVLLSPSVYAADQFPADSDFVRHADRLCHQAVTDAQVAFKMTKSVPIKRAAELMQRDGANASRRLATLAVEKGWPVPPIDAEEHDDVYSDNKYVSHQIKAQEDAISIYEEEAANGADTDLQEFARKALPSLHGDLLALQSLQES
jgi:predicted outer membrane protein